MAESISNVEKRKFVKELLKRFQMKKRECFWILNYIIDNESDELLKNVHFVDDIEGCDNVYMLSTSCSAEKPFEFILEGESTFEAQKALEYLKYNEDEDMYIKINSGFSLFKIDSYLTVLENNPKSKIPKEYSIEAAEFLNKMFEVFKVNMIKTRIDKAIDDKDRKAFIKYSDELKKMKQEV